MMISGLIIVKDDLERIGAAVASLKPLTDEIIVLDTGSVDSTPVAATAAGASVFHTKWQKDFSKARNEAIGLCSGDIIVTIDSDEEIVAGDSFHLDINLKKKILSAFSSDKIGGLECSIVSQLADNTSSSHTYTRAFRNTSEIRYEGKIHEQIRSAIEKLGLEIASFDGFVIKHKGYLEHSDSKIQRNREMLEDQIVQSDDPFDKFHLAETEFAANRLETAKPIYSEILGSPSLSSQQNDRSKIRLAQIALTESDHGQIDILLDFLASDCHHEGFRKYILAASLLERGQYKAALNYYNDKDVRQSEYVDNTVVEKAVSALGEVLG
jgi:glycosyltransferase involved in cell wall biosynthesis